MTLAIGFRPHTGWAIAVVLDGRSIVDRRRIDFAPTGMERQVFHAAVDRRDAAAYVSRASALAHEAAAQAVAAFDVSTAGIVGEPRELPELDRILANHTLLHTAEGELYRAVLEDACVARGWPVAHAHPKTLADEADSWKGAAKAPWQSDHRLAAAIALRSVRA